MSIPLTVRCECGEVLSAKAGEAVTCTCGRRYDTANIPGQSVARVRATQVRLRTYARLGFVVVILFGVLGFYVGGLPGVAFAAALSALVWWRVVAPWLRRRHSDELADLPSWTIEAERDA
jgi:hypothetical protein